MRGKVLATIAALVVGGSALWTALRPDVPAGETVTVRGTTFRVEVADDPIEQYRGLRDRPELPEDAGMLFLFDEAKARPFTMDRVLIPLDLIWIRDGRVVGVSADLPPAAQGANTRYDSPGPVDAVLEVRGGVAAAAGIAVGDPVTGSRSLLPPARTR